MKEKLALIQTPFKMKAEYIYVSKDGIPMTPTRYISKRSAESFNKRESFISHGIDIFKKIVDTAIPIREEDRQWAVFHIHYKTGMFSLTQDTFYPVEPYEFEKWWCDDHGCAKIILPSEPKKEVIYDAGNLNSSDNRNYGRTDGPFNFYNPWKDGKTPPPIPDSGDNIHGSKQAFELANQYNAGFHAGMEYQKELSEPKADPKEKELYSIKPLEWREEGGRHYGETLFGHDYEIWVNIEGTILWNLANASGGHIEMTEVATDIDDAKRAAQDHFNYKLKLCLNREL